MPIVEFEGKAFPFSADGFVSLQAFSGKVFDLSPEDLGAFFDPEYRFYDRYASIRHELRHNVRFRRVQSKSGGRVICEGGIYHEDFYEFVCRARQAIAANDQTFDEIVGQWAHNVPYCAVNRKSPALRLQLAQCLRRLAGILRKIAR